MLPALMLVLVLAINLAAGPAIAFSLPGRRPGGALPPAGTLDMGRSALQEVAPPVAVQQLQKALEGRRPRVEILSPADGALLPEGPWTLQLRAEDWPLVDAGPLGLGPHLVVQLDADPPLPLTTTTTTMRPLQPGSHRLTVYAARPWGEGVKSPGAQRQIRLHRVAANPLGVPAPGSPQLIAVSPRGEASASPLLLDWLLLDAPLQNLRAMDVGWRLRVSVNGDSFLVDQQTPLWLEGWRPGSNAIQLELLDGIGDPLNPPFNSLVGEVRLAPGGQRPRWQGGRLEPGELAALLGEAPPPSAPEPAPEPTPEPPAEAATEPDASPETPEPLEQETTGQDEAGSGGIPAEPIGTGMGTDPVSEAETEAPSRPTMEPQPDLQRPAGTTPPDSEGATPPEPASPETDLPGPTDPGISPDQAQGPSEPASDAAEPDPAPPGRLQRLRQWLAP